MNINNTNISKYICGIQSYQYYYVDHVVAYKLQCYTLECSVLLYLQGIQCIQKL